MIVCRTSSEPVRGHMFVEDGGISEIEVFSFDTQGSDEHTLGLLQPGGLQNDMCGSEMVCIEIFRYVRRCI